MSSLGRRISHLTGLKVDDMQSYWINDAAKEIITLLPQDRAAANATNITLPSSKASSLILHRGSNTVSFSALPESPFNGPTHMLGNIEHLVRIIELPDGTVSRQERPGQWSPSFAFTEIEQNYIIVLNSVDSVTWNLNVTGAEFVDGETNDFLNIDFYRILNVTRSDGTHFLPCRKINATDKGKASVNSGYMEEATKTDPVYYYENNKLVILPTPTTGQEANIDAIEYPNITHTETTLGNFPDEYENLVVLGAAIKAKMHQWSKSNIEEDFELSAMHANHLNALKVEYQTGLQLLITGMSQQLEEKGGQ